MRRVLAPLPCLILSALPALAQEREVGSAGGWDVVAGTLGETTYCAADREVDGRAVRIRHDGADWALIFDAPEAEGLVTGFDIDGTAHPTGSTREGDLVSLALSEASKEAVRNGIVARIAFGAEEIELSLKGTAAAGLRVASCVEAGGAPVDDDSGLLVEPGAAAALETGPIGPGCPDREESVSAVDGPEGSVTLTWDRPEGAPGVVVYWLDPFGRLLPVPAPLSAATPEVTLAAYGGQSFLVRDATGACLGGLIRADGSAQTVAIR